MGDGRHIHHGKTRKRAVAVRFEPYERLAFLGSVIFRVFFAQITVGTGFKDLAGNFDT